MIVDLKERRLFEQTLVVIVGDHGEAFGEHGEERPRHFLLRGERSKVPADISPIAGLPKNARASDSAYRLVDVMPTVLEMLGIDVSE